ncbi:methylglutaconyl-CoA hydratase [Pseudidiomarina planktonica]|uniref:Methylglutaconyl-CoA hydratase n=1 Tax=Pseudidiomarina planktonica TaxID=1323738 RepID=A0A1Y6ENP5_9GAMM|nr:enoyl-CoA hydratase-related protein [Pseudidiomarina planktonica]RUO65585.1 gamma-carboxygeranoyl-CoA hydratase [Pseudidiomarina planktonica]SMQ64284.1 methylglutaconyl-CoA hydratase [Pseudidiomarina planktonica]
MTEFTTLDIAENGVARLTMNRPDVHNAFNDAMIAELLQKLAQVDQHPRARVLVLQANGKSFSAGADLNWMRSMAEKDRAENVADASQLSLLMQRLDELSKPTFCLVQGAAFGGAVGLAACCDIALATPRASFCLSEVKIGLIPAVISPYVIRAMGVRQARRYMLTAERFDAETARACGLIHTVADDLEEALAPLLDAILANGPAALQACKTLIAQVGLQPITATVRQTTIEHIADIRVSAEGQEGLAAFLEKRSANWSRG